MRLTTAALVMLGLLGSTPVAQGQAAPETRARELLERLAAGGDTDAIAADLAGLGEGAQPAIVAALPRLRRVRDARAVLWALAEHPTPRAREAFIRSSLDRRAAVKQAATEHLRLFPGEPAVTAALLRLIDDQDEPTAELALGAFMTGAFPAWPSLLDALARELRSSPPREGRVYPLARSLEALLAADDRPEERLRELLDACAWIDDPLARARLFDVVPRSGAAALRPVLLRLLEEACPAPAGPAGVGDGVDLGFEAAQQQAALDDLFAPDGPFEPLRPFSVELIATVAGELGRAAHGPAFGPVLRAAADRRDSAIRRAALKAVWSCAATDEERDRALRALAESLVAGDRSIRTVAHAVLRKVTAQELPMSHAAWSAWIGARAAARVARAELEQRASDAGYDRVEDYVRDHPEDAPRFAEESSDAGQE